MSAEYLDTRRIIKRIVTTCYVWDTPCGYASIIVNVETVSYGNGRLLITYNAEGLKGQLYLKRKKWCPAVWKLVQTDIQRVYDETLGVKS